jgi:phosphohistidine swiveling domain-containing protein
MDRNNGGAVARSNIILSTGRDDATQHERCDLARLGQFLRASGMKWIDAATGLFASHPASTEGPVRVVVGLQAIVALMREPSVEPSIIVTNEAGGSAISTIIRHAKGIVSTIGGANSHIVVVARDYNVPCIVGASGLNLDSLETGTRMRMNVDGRVQIADASARELSPDELKMLRLIVFAGALPAGREVVGFGEGDVQDTLASLSATGLIENGPVIAPTNAGIDALEDWYHADRSALEDPQREQVIERFRPLDVELKRVASAWQDAASAEDWNRRMEVIEALTTLHGRTVEFVNSYAVSVPRWKDYMDRLGRAYARVLDGDTGYVVGVRVDSYHTIWSQFHEDLLRLVERERDPE